MTTASPPGTADPTPDLDRPSAPRIAWWPVAVIATLTGAVHLALASVDGRWFDEVLMVAIGRHHLDWGSADQPPVAPLLAALADTVAPDSQLALRVPAVLATAGAVLLAGLVARELGGDTRAQTLTALAQATAVWATLFGHWLTPYSLEPVQWLAIVWLLLRWVRVRDDRLLLALGLVVGLAAETKFQVLLLAVVLLVCVLALGPRALLRRPMLWVGAAIAVALAVPTLVWQALHGWPQIAMGPVVASEAGALYGGRTGVALQLVIGAGVLGTVLGLLGAVRLLAAPDMRPYRFLGVATVVFAVLVVVPPGRPYYLAGLYGLLAAAGAVGLQRRREAGQRRWSWVAWPAGAVAVGVAVAVLSVSTLLSSPVIPERIATATATAYGALPAPQRAHTAILGQSYVYATYVDAYSVPLGLPQAYSTNRSYGYFDLPPDDDDAVLWIGDDPGGLRPSFADARPVAAVPSDGSSGLTGEDTGTTIWLLTGRHVPWERIWATQRSLTVS